MAKQYPYTLQIQVDSTGPIQDGDGNWFDGGPVWVDYCKCRDENGKGIEIKGESGNKVTASFIAFCHKGTERLSVNTNIQILDADGNVRESGQVIYSRKDQYNTKLWV